MPTAAGLFKQVAYKEEVTYGTVPSAASAQLLRRVKSSLDMTKDVYESNEIRADFQVADMRHGVRRVGGSIDGELSPGTYKDFFAASLKKAFAAITPSTSVSLTIAGTSPTFTVTRAAGSFLTDGYKIGHVIRLSVGSLNAANINKNLMITALTATVATVLVLNGVAMVAEGPIAGCTVTATGKNTWVPSTSHTNKSFSIEHFFSDLTQSEVFSGCKVAKIGLSLPPTGMATCNIEFKGQSITTASAQYFTSPTAATTTGNLASVNGVLRVNATSVANVTGLSMDIMSDQTGDATVGSNVITAQYPGRVKVSGQFTAYFDSVTLRDAFINETEIDLYAAFTANNTATSDFVAIGLPRIKLGSSNVDDGEGGLIRTYSYTALLNLSLIHI